MSMEKMMAIWACALAALLGVVSLSVAWVQVEEARAGIIHPAAYAHLDGGIP